MPEQYKSNPVVLSAAGGAGACSSTARSKATSESRRYEEIFTRISAAY